MLDHWLQHLKVLERYPSYKENIELDGFSYEAMERRKLDCLRLLKKIVDREQIEIVGGSYSAPPMIIIDGESNIRQILLGKEIIKRLFDVDVKSFAVQEGGICSHPQLPQILTQTGYESCVIGCMDGYDFVQGRGVDGTAIPTIIKSYWDPLPNDPNNISEIFGACQEQPDRLVMPMPDWSWGAAKPEWIEEAARQKGLITVVSSNFFNEHRPKQRRMLSEVEWKPETKITDLAAPRVTALLDIGYGCEIPKMNRYTENLLIAAEKYQGVASFVGLNPRLEELENCWKILFTAQAHDNYFDGTVSSLKAWAKGLFKQAAKEAEALLLEALNHIAKNVNTTLQVSGWILDPVIVFNQLTWERNELITFEQSFKMAEAKTIEVADKDGNSVPYQIEDAKKHPDGSLKSLKICFLAQLPSLGYNTYYICSSKRSDRAEYEYVCTKQKRRLIENEFVQVRCEKNGEIRIRDLATSKEVFRGGFLTLHDQDGFDDSRQYPVETEKSWSGHLKSNIFLEGQLRRGSYQTAITMKKGSREVSFKTKVKISDALIGKNVTWWCMRPESGLANHTILDIKDGTLWHDYPFGCTQTDSSMILPLNWMDYSNDKQGVGVFHSGVPFFWRKQREPLELMNIWLWSPLASQLDWSKANQLMRSGTYTYQYAVMPHAKNWMKGHVFQEALQYNNPPLIARTSLHNGSLPKQKSFISINKENVILSALIPKTDHLIFRLYEIYGRKTDFNMAFDFPGLSKVNRIENTRNSKNASRHARASGKSLSKIIDAHEIACMHASRVAIQWSRKKNPPLMDPWEADLLIKYARKCKIHFVEIGTHKGGSASLISKYLPQNVNLTTIDTFEKPPKGSVPPEKEPPKYEEAKETIEQQGDISKVQIIKGHSWEVAETWDKDIDILFIDGDHRYHAVKKDFDSWGPHVVKNGYILMHDIDFKGVRKAYREIVRNAGFLLEERVGTLAVLKRKLRIKAVFFDLGDTLVNEEVLLEKGKVQTLPYTHEALKSLKSKYKLAIICDTDASQEKVIELLEEAKIAEYFDLVVVSSEVGSSKPDEKIFRTALEKLDLRADEVVMIGNRISRDILGGNKVGMKTIHLKWNDRYREEVTTRLEQPAYTVKSLKELVPLLFKLKC